MKLHFFINKKIYLSTYVQVYTITIRRNLSVLILFHIQVSKPRSPSAVPKFCHEKLKLQILETIP